MASVAHGLRVLLDFHGEFTVSPDTNAILLNLTTRSRVVQGGLTSSILREGAMTCGREVASTIRLAPGEVVAVELPRLGENDAAAFANHAFSIRVRSREIR